MPARAFNGLYLLFLFGWFLSVFVHTRWEAAAHHDRPGTHTLRSASTVLLGLGLLVSTHFHHAALDLRKG